MRHVPKPASSRHSGMMGFTLVELMVSSIILGLTVAAVAFMIVNSGVIRISNDHYRQARMIAQEELEDIKHHFSRYATAPGLENQPINLDPGEERITPAMRNLPVTPGNFAITVDAVSVSVPYKKLASTVTWTEDGLTKSLTLAKRIVNVR